MTIETMTQRTAQLDAATLRKGYGCFPTGIVAVCATIEDEPVGIAASSFVPVSMEPPLVSFCIQWTSTTWPKLETAPRLGLSVLGENHDRAARSLASKTGDRFADLKTSSSDEGALFVHGSTAWLDCSIHEVVPAGDHGIVLLRVHALQTNDESHAPLVFHSSAFRALKPLED